MPGQSGSFQVRPGTGTPGQNAPFGLRTRRLLQTGCGRSGFALEQLLPSQGVIHCPCSRWPAVPGNRSAIGVRAMRAAWRAVGHLPATAFLSHELELSTLSRHPDCRLELRKAVLHPRHLRLDSMFCGDCADRRHEARRHRRARPASRVPRSAVRDGTDRGKPHQSEALHPQNQQLSGDQAANRAREARVNPERFRAMGVN